MNTAANTGGNHFRNGIRRISGNAIKVNKTSTIYESTSADCISVFNTAIFRLEVDRGFHKATDCKFQLRVKDKRTWDDSSRISCLFSTQFSGIYRGDIPEGVLRTMIFIDMRNADSVLIYVLPKGSNPRTEINRIAAELC